MSQENHNPPKIRRFVPPKSLREVRDHENPNNIYVDYAAENTISPDQLKLVADRTSSSRVTPSATQTAYLQARVNQARRTNPPKLGDVIDADDPIAITAQIQAQIDAQKEK